MGIFAGMTCELSIVLPAKNESQGLPKLLQTLNSEFPDAEIIVVNDGSTDKTGEIAAEYASKVITHPYSLGNGAAIKSGTRASNGKKLVFLDADGQHKPSDIHRLLEKLDENYSNQVDSYFNDITSNKYVGINAGVGMPLGGIGVEIGQLFKDD